MRDWIFAALLIVAGVSIVYGVAGWSVPAAFVTAGVLLVGWAVLVFVVGEAGKPEPAAEVET